MQVWNAPKKSHRTLDWPPCELYLVGLIRLNVRNVLYHPQASRVTAPQELPADPLRDGTTDIQTN